MEQQRATLLIVDDERGPAESLRMIFKPLYNVLIATGGEAALELIRTHRVDVVTLDLRMPRLPGTEVLRQIKMHDPYIEVIIVTGYSSLDSALQGIRCGAFDYISKPFDVPHVIDLVRRAMARRKARVGRRRAKEDFLANLSHELRTPLSAIIGYTSILSEELKSSISSDQTAALGRIQSNAFDLLALVEGILLLNAIDAGDVEMDVRTFNVEDVVRRTVAKFADLAEEKGLRLHIENALRAISITNDEAKLEKVLAALLDNAIKFTKSGGLTLALRRSEREGAVDIEVRDTGIGMEAEELRQAMEGLSQGDPSPRRRFRGLGIGMRLVTQLTQLVGGEVRITSAVNEGTNVTITVPTFQPSAQATLN